MLLNDIFKLPKTGKFKLKRFLISNWSRGEIKLFILLFVNKAKLWMI